MRCLQNKACFYTDERKIKDSQMSTDTEGLYKELTYKIIGALYEVHNELGFVHKENIYNICANLRKRGYPYKVNLC